MINFKNISLSTIGWSLLFIVVVYFPTLHYINHLPLKWWDESLFGLRALYMHNTGSYLSDFQLFDGLMPHRNTKMPFTTLIQVLFMKVIGVKVLALRLPIVLIFIATIAFTLRFTKKHLSAISIGVLFTMIMVCSPGIVREHVLRSGEQDMPFLCYLFVMVISYYQYLEKRNKKYLILFAASITAALLTKNLLAGAFLPGLLLYTIYVKKLKEVLTDKFIWIAILSVVSTFGGVIFYLENAYPGFIDRMWGYELMGRYTNAKDGHRGGFGFFFNDLAFKSFKIYFWMVPLSLLILLTNKMDGTKSRLMICLASVYFSYLLVISFAETKLFWYGVPIIPLGALIIAIALHHIYVAYLSSQNRIVKYGLSFLFVALIFAIPYNTMVEKILSSEIEHGQEKFGVFIERVLVDHPTIVSYTLAERKFGPAAMWYKEKYRMEQKVELKYSKEVSFENGETVMTCLYDVTPKIHKKYDTEVIQNWEGCQLLRIIKEK